MGYIQTIEIYRNLYLNSLNCDEFRKAEKDVLSIYHSQNAFSDVKESAYRLVILLKTKRRLLTYFTEFTEEAYTNLYEESKKLLAVEKVANYALESKLLKAVLSLAPAVKKVVDSIIDNNSILTNLNYKTANSQVPSDVLKECESLEILINGLEFDGFETNVKFIDFKNILLEEVGKLKRIASNCISKIEKARIQELLDKFLVKFDMKYSFQDIYCPLVNFSNYSNLLIINSPIIDEVKLFIEAYRKSFNKEVYMLNANYLEKESDGKVREIFNIIKAGSADLFITNLYKYDSTNKEVLFKELYKYAEAGSRVFIYNNLVHEDLYEYFINLTDGINIRASLIGNMFFALPSFNESISFLQKNGIEIKNELMPNIKQELCFLGYEGLNLALYEHKQGKNWYVIGRKISNRNQSEYPITKYIKKITSQSLFIDTDWGNFKEAIKLNETRNFDYDILNQINDDFVNEIVYSDYNLIEKCGVLIRYILTGGNDYTVLEDMDIEELTERITRTTTLVMSLLGLDFKPEVIIENVVDGDKNIRGLCVNAGRIIRYRTATCRDGDIIRTLPHECYHAFQHLTELGYRQWFWDELFVSEARTKYWKENFKSYTRDLSEFYIYYNQVVEADARTFADDCVEAADRLWHKFNFKK